MPSTIGPIHKRDLLKLHFNGVPFTLPTSFYASLHTASPSGGDQSTNEASYGGYTRKLIGRTTAEWSVYDSGGGVWVAELLTKIEFPNCSSGSGTYTHVGLGDSSAGAGTLRLWAVLSSPLVISADKTPRVIEGTLFNCEC
ncbi:MAG: hypothetical protein U0871_24455 [Gemmataceae bacterium]